MTARELDISQWGQTADWVFLLFAGAEDGLDKLGALQDAHTVMGYWPGEASLNTELPLWKTRLQRHLSLKGNYRNRAFCCQDRPMGSEIHAALDTCCLCMSVVSARRLGFFISKNVGRAARPHLGRCGLSRQEGAEVSERKRPFAHLKQTGRDPAPSATPGRHREALRSTGCEVSLNKHGQLQHKAERQRQVEISTARRSAAQVTWPIATPISTFLTNNVWPGGGWDLPVCFFIFVMSRCHSWSRNCFKQTAEKDDLWCWEQRCRKKTAKKPHCHASECCFTACAIL